MAATALNRLLRQQAWARDYLRPYAGKAVRVQLADWALALRVREEGLTQASKVSEPADVVLTLAPAHLGEAFGALRRHEPDRLAALVHIEGEAALAQAVLALAQNLRWDAEDELAQVLGDRAARVLVGAFKEAGQGVRQAGKSLAENVAEYLSYESDAHENPLLLAQPVFDDWTVQVQALLQRLDTLEAALTSSALTAQRELQSC